MPALVTVAGFFICDRLARYGVLNLALDACETTMADTKQVKATGQRKPPAAGKGRVKGSLNKTTKSAKDAIAAAAEALGGAERLAAWAQEDPANERVFWGTIYPKLLPLQVTGEGGGAVIVQLAPLDDRI